MIDKSKDRDIGMTYKKPKKMEYFIWALLTLISITYALFIFLKSSILVNWSFNSDQLTIPSFIQDIINNQNNYSGWQLSRATFLFPDALIYFFLYTFGFDPVNSVLLSIGFISLIWLYLLFSSFPKSIYIPFSQKCAFTLFFGYWVPVLLTQNFPILATFIFKYLFSFANHFSCFIFSSLCILWTIDYINEKKTQYKLLFIISLISFFLTASNPLVYIYFYTPILVLISLLLVNSDKIKQSKLIDVFLMLTIALSLGYSLSSHLNKQTIMPMHPVKELFHQTHLFFKTLLFFIQENLPILIFFVFLLTTYTLSLFECFKKWSLFFYKKLSPRENRDFLLVTIFCITGILNFFAAISVWEGIGSIRYLMFFLFSPFILLIHLVANSKLSYYLFFSKITLFSLTLILLIKSLFLQIQASSSIDFLKEEINKATMLNKCIKELHLHRGLAEYWSARKTQFLSYNSIQLAQIPPWELTANNLLFYWGNNAYSFIQNEKDSNIFDFILMDKINNTNKAILAQTFGKPSRVTYCDKQEIWIYRDKTTIFSGLIEGHSEPYIRQLNTYNHVKIPAIAFRSLTGKRSSFSRIAYQNSSSPNFLLFGNYIPLKKGIYRFDLEYKIKDDSEENKTKSESIFEIVTSSGNEYLASKNITYINDDKNRRISLTIRLSKNRSVEPRIVYNGKGILSIVSISITAI